MRCAFFQRPSLLPAHTHTIIHTVLFCKWCPQTVEFFSYTFFSLGMVPHFAEVRLPAKQLKQFSTTRLHFIDVTLDFFLFVSLLLYTRI